MSGAIGAAGAPGAPGAPGRPEAELRRAAQQLEGVFVAQLFAAMRATVPAQGLTGGGAGEEMFSSLMDQHLSAEVPAQLHGGLSAALYRELRRHLSSAAPEAAHDPHAISS